MMFHQDELLDTEGTAGHHRRTSALVRPSPTSAKAKPAHVGRRPERCGPQLPGASRNPTPEQAASRASGRGGVGSRAPGQNTLTLHPDHTLNTLTASFFDEALNFEPIFDENEWISTCDSDNVIFDTMMSEISFFDVSDGCFDLCALI